MKKLMLKTICFASAILAMVVCINYFIDPASLYHGSIVDAMAKELLDGNIIESPGDVDEGLFQKKMISSMDEKDVVILGSSHIMYQPWDFQGLYVAGLSGAYMGDYYAIVGLMDYYWDKMPCRVIIGVDPWAFSQGVADGRHQSISGYAENELSVIEGKYSRSSNEGKMIGRDRANFSKLRELVSFAYFQSSVHAFKTNGLTHYTHREEIVVCNNDDIGEKGKILPDGRHIISKDGFCTKEKNDNNAKAAINSKSIYQLGGGFSEIPEDNLGDFKRFVSHLVKAGVEIDFYFHPWYPSVYKYFEADGSYSGVIKLESYLRNMAEEYGIMVHGSYNPYLLNMTEEDFADWLHLKPDRMLDSYNIVLARQ